MRGIIVHHEVHIEIGRHYALDLIEELAELGGAVAAIALADDMARGNVEGSKQGSCAVTGIIVAAPCGLTGPHRQHGLAAVERFGSGTSRPRTEQQHAPVARRRGRRCRGLWLQNLDQLRA